jgi:hypothetical protein
MQDDLRRAIADRNAAVRRVRRATGAVIVAGAALTAALGAVAGTSTHFRKTVARRAPATTVQTAPVVAPAPPIVAAHAQSTATPPASSSSTPAATQAAPVVVSGGS